MVSSDLIYLDISLAFRLTEQKWLNIEILLELFLKQIWVERLQT